MTALCACCEGPMPEATGLALLHLRDAGRARWFKGKWAL